MATHLVYPNEPFNGGITKELVRVGYNRLGLWFLDEVRIQGGLTWRWRSGPGGVFTSSRSFDSNLFSFAQRVQAPFAYRLIS